MNRCPGTGKIIFPKAKADKVQTAESMIAVWPQTMKAFSLWVDKRAAA